MFKEKLKKHTRKILNIFTSKTAILGTSRVIRELLHSETCSLSDGDRHWFKKSTGEKRSVTGDNNNNIIIIIIILTI